MIHASRFFMMLYPFHLHRNLQLGLNLLIIGLWLWFYRPVYDYLAIIFSREDFRTNQIILVGVLGLIAYQFRQGEVRPRLNVAPRLFWPGLVLALGGSLLFLAVERFLDINTLSASLFGLASYGLLGLWLEPRRWRQGVPAALLLVGALPFGEHMQTFIGYPMRLLTAAIVRDGLAAAGVASIGVDTILVFENGISQVDLPCSGVKSLWTGLLFLIAATWLERRPLNFRWLLLALFFAALLFIANLGRVGLLVLIGQVAGWPLAAELLHVPLGVLGFVAACAAAVGLLRRRKVEQGSRGAGGQGSKGAREQKSRGDREIGRPGWLGPGLAVVVLGLGLLYAPRPHTGLAQAAPVWEFGDELTTEPAPLTPAEIDWLTRDGAESAERRRFSWQGLSGSMILITSATWRAHHRPERCFEVYGLSIDDSRTHLVRPDFPLRLVALGEGSEQYWAAYWFQSSSRTTDDYGSRIWADLALERERWVLVSVLFDDLADPQAAEAQAFYAALHHAVSQELAE
jgi:exosortase O